MSFYHGAAEQAERRTSIIKYLEATLVEPVQGATSWGFSDLPVIKDSPVPEQTKFRTHTHTRRHTHTHTHTHTQLLTHLWDFGRSKSKAEKRGRWVVACCFTPNLDTTGLSCFLSCHLRGLPCRSLTCISPPPLRQSSVGGSQYL